jgi:hypothetical protein
MSESFLAAGGEECAFYAPSPLFLAAAVQTWQRQCQSASIFLLVGASPWRSPRIFAAAVLSSFDLTTSWEFLLTFDLTTP